MKKNEANIKFYINGEYGSESSPIAFVTSERSADLRTIVSEFPVAGNFMFYQAIYIKGARFWLPFDNMSPNDHLINDDSVIKVERLS